MIHEVYFLILSCFLLPWKPYSKKNPDYSTISIMLLTYLLLALKKFERVIKDHIMNTLLANGLVKGGHFAGVYMEEADKNTDHHLTLTYAYKHT